MLSASALHHLPTAHRLKRLRQSAFLRHLPVLPSPARTQPGNTLASAFCCGRK